MMYAVFLWILLSLSFLILELGHPGLFFFLSFSIGACSAAVFAYFDYGLFAQIPIFFGATFAALFCLRVFLKKFHRSTQKTNVYALIGKQGVVVQQILPEQPGYVKVEGQLWLARPVAHGIGVDCPIKVIDARGAHLVVEQLKYL